MFGCLYAISMPAHHCLAKLLTPAISWSEGETHVSDIDMQRREFPVSGVQREFPLPGSKMEGATEHGDWSTINR